MLLPEIVNTSAVASLEEGPGFKSPCADLGVKQVSTKSSWFCNMLVTRRWTGQQMGGEMDGLTGNTPLYFLSLSLIEVGSPSSTGEQAVRKNDTRTSDKKIRKIRYIYWFWCRQAGSITTKLFSSKLRKMIPDLQQRFLEARLDVSNYLIIMHFPLGVD